MKNSPRYQSSLKQARGHGPSRHAVQHWWVQRLTALALVPLGVWLAVSLIRVAQYPDPFMVADWMSSPIRAGALALLVVAMFWHLKLGLQVIIEDYMHCPCKKYTLLILNNFICFAAAGMSLLAILRLHMLDLVAGT